jgi:hypothetical protein
VFNQVRHRDKKVVLGMRFRAPLLLFDYVSGILTVFHSRIFGFGRVDESTSRLTVRLTPERTHRDLLPSSVTGGRIERLI